MKTCKKSTFYTRAAYEKKENKYTQFCGSSLKSKYLTSHNLLKTYKISSIIKGYRKFNKKKFLSIAKVFKVYF